MTSAAVWFADDRLYAVADTRIVREPGNILTEHGPKLAAVSVVCRVPGASGFFDQIFYFTTIGFVFAGATFPALSTAALAGTLLQNLIGQAGSPPSLADLAGSIRSIAHHYMHEIGQLSGPAALFESVVFGFCGATNRYRAFSLTPSTSTGPLDVILTEHDICAPDTLVAIGSQPSKLRARVAEIREGAHPVVAGDAPRRALRSLMAEGSDPTIGGAIQYGWCSRQGFELVADAVPIQRLPSGRNAASRGLPQSGVQVVLPAWSRSNNLSLPIVAIIGSELPSPARQN